jgi:rod shape-determining protein MreC
MPPFEPDQLRSSARKDNFLAGFFVLLATVLLLVPPHSQEQVSAALRGSVLAPFIFIQESLRQTRIRAVEVAELQDRLDAAVAALAARSTLLDENARLRTLLDLRERAGPGFRSASVIRAGVRGSESMFLLDVGSSDGVQVYDPVVSGDGLVGVIREVGPRASVAMDWTHPDFRVSAMTLDGEAFGFVEPRHGAFREEDRLLLNGVPYHTPVAEGTAVVTSGRGVVLRGILVGAVDSLAETEAGWRRSYWVRPAVRPAAVTHVLVITAEGGRSADDLLHLWLEPPKAPTDTVPRALEEVPPGGGP